MIFFWVSEGQVWAAWVAWWASRCSRASRLSAVPGRVGNSGSVGVAPRSASQTRRAAVVVVVSGVIRSLRPLPWQLTCAPLPRWTSPQVRPISSEARRPVWMVSRSRVWSRRPVQVVVSGLASSASASASVRNVMIAWSNRFGGMASTRWMSAACSGWCSAANRNREWMAARRALRVRVLLPRWCCRWSRNAAISGAFRSATSSWAGLFPVCSRAKRSSSRSVSR